MINAVNYQSQLKKKILSKNIIGIKSRNLGATDMNDFKLSNFCFTLVFLPDSNAVLFIFKCFCQAIAAYFYQELHFSISVFD